MDTLNRMAKVVGAPVAGVALLGLAVVGAISDPAAAHEGTPSTAVECVAPALPEGEPTPPDATPAAMPEAPSRTPVPAGEAANEEQATHVIAAAENFLACYNGGDYEGAVALMTPDAWLAEFFTDNPWDAVAQLPEFAQPYAVQSLGEAQAHADGSLSVDVVYVEGPHQVKHERWYFVAEGEHLLFDGREALPVTLDGEHTTVDVAMVEMAFELSQETVPAGDVILNVTNAGAILHETVVVRLPEGATVEQVLAGEVPFEEVVVAGVFFGEPGAQGQIALTGLEPGTYTLVCFVDVPDGTPHIMQGMVAGLTVE